MKGEDRMRRGRRLRMEMLERRELMAVDLAKLFISSPFSTDSIDGTGNNSSQSVWGSTGEKLLRLARAEYADGIAAPIGTDRPSGREISQSAEQMQSNTLTRLIDLEGFDTELAQLGNVLNSMFSRLNEAFQRQRRFVADASHELRTPLTVIMTSAELALSKERSPDEYRIQLETCQRSANRMRQLVDALLTLARLDGKETTETYVSIDLAELVDENLTWLESLAKDHEVTLKAVLQPCLIHGNPSLLNQVITNLVMNAIQYNRPGGVVHVTVAIEGTDAILKVQDSGVGIAPSNLPHLFERFFRVDQARSRNTGGVGLGLAICQRIVEIHGGTIEASSTVGEGSVFTVRIRSALSHGKSGLDSRLSPD